MRNNLERPSDGEADCSGQDEVFVVLWPQGIWLWDHTTSESSKIHVAFVVLDVGHDETIGHQEGDAEQIRIGHYTLECTGLSTRVPSNACKAVVAVQVVNKKDEFHGRKSLSNIPFFLFLFHP